MLGIIIFAIAFGLIGRWLALAIFDAIFGNQNQEKTNTYIDKSVHHHYHDNRSVHLDKETFNGNKIT